MNPVLKKFTALLFVCFLLFFTSAGNASSLTQDSTGALDAALSYLTTQQSPDGGINGLTGTSDPGTTARAILAFAANGVNPVQLVSSDGKSPITYLSENYSAYVYDESGLLFPANAGLVLAALSKGGAAPDELSAQLSSTLQDDGSYATEASAEFTSGAVTDLNQAFAILGLLSGDQEIPSQAVNYLINRQAEDGTWDNGFGPDLDTSAIVMIALLGSGQVEPSHPTIISTLELFRVNQQENGGWKPVWDTDALNVDTTGWITQALITAREDLNNWKQGENTPVSALISQQQPDGSIGGTYVNAYSTVEALFGLAQNSIVPTTGTEQPTQISGENMAGLVIQLDPGNVIQQCIPFTDNEFSGADLLQASGLDLEVSINPSMGSLVCSIEDTGCPKEDCFCDMPNYWSYWVLTDGEWGYAQSGSDTLVVQTGTVQGWSWGDAPPPAVTFNQICGQSEQVVPTAMPVENQPTDLPQPTNTSESIEEVTPIVEPVETQPVPPETNFTLYYVFGGLLVILVVVIVIISSKRK